MLSLMMMVVLGGGGGAAWAQAAPGAAVLAYDGSHVFPAHSDPVVNVGVAADGSGRLLVIETASVTASPPEVALDFVSFPVGGAPTTISAMAMRAVGGGIYPSLALMPALVLTTEKVPLAGTSFGIMGIVRAARSPFGSVYDYGAVSSATRKAGRSSLGVGPGSGAPQYLCFTDGDSNTTPPQDQDLLERESNAGALWPVPVGADTIIYNNTGTQDHCQTVTDALGAQWIAFHDDQTAAEGVRLTRGATFPGTPPSFLPGSDDHDFPTIATLPNTLAHEVVAVKNGQMSLWSCLQTPGHCSTKSSIAPYGNTLSNWTAPVVDTVAGSFADPKLVLVEREVPAEGGNGYDRFLLVQDAGGSSSARVRLWKWCDGALNWTDTGPMPVPPTPFGGTAWRNYTEMGPYDKPSSGTSVFTSVGRTLHAAYIGCNKSTNCTAASAELDAIAWTASTDDVNLCP